MLKVAIIGCGNIFTMHATSAHHLKNAQIVAVCDVKKDREPFISGEEALKIQKLICDIYANGKFN
jgi:predicted dehydrogenase